MLKNIRSIFAVESIKNKIIATLLLVLVYKFLSIIPVPWANTAVLKEIFSNNSWLGFFSSLMWWGMSNFSIILMGLSPYINALIIIQLLGVIVPQIWALQKEWEAGQKKITKWTRFLTLPLAFVQSYWMILLLNTLAWSTSIIDITNIYTVLMAMTIITAWTIFLMWLWEYMTEVWIWNGISIVITAWVLAAVPNTVMSTLSKNDYFLFLLLLVATLAIIYVIIKFTEWNRRIPVIYSRSWREEKSYLPIKVNQAWMIPIIFAVSLVTFPVIISQLLSRQGSSNPIIANVSNFISQYLDMWNPSWLLIIIYFLLVLGFSFFYVSITFNTENLAENIQKRGGFIPTKRPWTETAEYLASVSAKLNLFWWSFLALIAVLPYIISKFANTQVDFIISWAWLIIIVSVILDILRKLDSEMKMFDYTKYK